MLAEQKTAQLRVIGHGIIAEGSAGQIFWATPTRARLLIDIGAAELVNQFAAPVIGPSETKPAEPAEKKSFPAVPDGRLTDSAPSIESGKAAPSSSLAEDRASREKMYSESLKHGIVKPSPKRGRPAKSKR